MELMTGQPGGGVGQAEIGAEATGAMEPEWTTATSSPSTCASTISVQGLQTLAAWRQLLSASGLRECSQPVRRLQFFD